MKFIKRIFLNMKYGTLVAFLHFLVVDILVITIAAVTMWLNDFNAVDMTDASITITGFSMLISAILTMIIMCIIGYEIHFIISTGIRNKFKRS